MPKQVLTQSFVDKVKCDSSKPKVDYFDTKVSGLVLKVLISGKKSYYLRYQDKRGKVTEKRLSSVDATALQLNEARALATGYLNKIAVGDDPFATKAELKQVITVADFVKNHYLPFIQVNKRSWKTDESLLRNHVIPTFGSLYMDEFTPQHLIRFIGEHSKSHANGSVNRVVIIMRYMYNLALKWKIAGVNSNPTASVPLLEENNQKERFLTEKETERLIYFVNKSDNKLLKYIVPALLLTGSRKREVLDLEWSDIDFEKRLWRLAAADNKSKKTRWVPLSDGMYQLLQLVPRIEGCNWVFANPKTKKPFVSIYCSWDTARNRADLADVRMHDLRHSYASFLINAGGSIYELKELLGHTQIKTTLRYAHLSKDTLRNASNTVSAIITAANERSLKAA